MRLIRTTKQVMMKDPNDTPKELDGTESWPSPETDPDRSEKWVTPAGGVTLVFPDSQCLACLHYNTGGSTCTAFPTGIPLSIWFNRHNHMYPWPGDDGVRFVDDPRNQKEFNYRLAKKKLPGGRIIDPSRYRE